MPKRSLAFLSQPTSTARVYTTSEAAMRAANDETGEAAQGFLGVLGPAAQEPMIRLTFRDGVGQIQAATLNSSHRLYIGRTRAEQRKQIVWRAFERTYRELGCELLTLELVQSSPASLAA